MSSRSIQIRFGDSRLGPTIEKPCPLTLPGSNDDDELPTLESLQGDSAKSLLSLASTASLDSCEHDCCSSFLGTDDVTHTEASNGPAAVARRERSQGRLCLMRELLQHDNNNGQNGGRRPTQRRSPGHGVMHVPPPPPPPRRRSAQTHSQYPVQPRPVRRCQVEQQQLNPCPHPQRNHHLAGNHPPNSTRPQQQPDPSARGGVTMIEIAPGVRVRLRGAHETWQCVQRDEYASTTCWGCALDLCCIADASYVLCPRCQVVSPLGGNDGGDEGEPRQGGVGLGFTADTLRKIQYEILR